VKVIHFVTGGFSGATQVAVDLTGAAQAAGSMQALLVLRRKRSTPMQRVQALRSEGLHVEMVPGWSHLATITALAQLCRRERPDVMVAHGFPEHLIGRWAALAAGVPHLVQVEHNSKERYTRFRLAQARWLTQRTDRIVGVSSDVRDNVIALGMPAAKVVAIPNGIRLARFADADQTPLHARTPGLVMAARFASQKDHATLLQAVHRLRALGHAPPVLLAGVGGNHHERRARTLCRELGLDDQVQFLGHVSDLPRVLMRHRIAVMSSHFEGFCLALAEGMAAGCVSIGTDVPGIRPLIDNGVDGLLVAHKDPDALARAISRCLSDTDFSSRLAHAGRARALAQFSRDTMLARYEALIREVVATS
jgi:glycosyltransferase involved in cell wall biosynthesis